MTDEPPEPLPVFEAARCRLCGGLSIVKSDRRWLVCIAGHVQAIGVRGDDPRHGTLTGYNSHHCRCDACRRAKSDYYRAYRRRTLRAAS